MTNEALAAPQHTVHRQEPEWMVWLLVAAMLAVGVIVRAVVSDRTAQFANEAVAFSYPADWAGLASDSPFEQAAVGEPMESGLSLTSFRILQMPITEISTTAPSPADLALTRTAGDLALQWSNRHNEALLGYRVYSMEEVTVAGIRGVKVVYGYVAEPVMGGPNSVPVVAQAADILLPRGDAVTVVTFTAASAEFERLSSAMSRVLSSLVLK